ncbi:MAG: bifunctional alpha/beta hydrolase/OsmC family protein [Pseudomonadota bacterium]
MSKITFQNRIGQSLVGNLERPPGGHWQATALFAHCFTCSRNIKAARTISRALAKAGIAVLRFDFTGLGESEGDFADTDFSSNLDDLEDAAHWMSEHLNAPQLLIGHSLGGTAVVAVAERLPEVRALATIGAPSSPDHVLAQFDHALDSIESQGRAEVQLAGRPFTIRKDFIDDVQQQSLAERLTSLRRALLILHSPVDEVVSIEQAQALYEQALHPKSFISLDQADHLLNNEHDALYVSQLLASWASRYLQLNIESTSHHATAAGRTEDGFRCRLQLGEHTWLADEPTRVGGTNTGPDPYQQLAGALASCTVMTLNLYARHKQLPIDRVTCSVDHQRIHADDCEDCASRTGKIDELVRNIRIEGALEPTQCARMLEIADRCPVHKTLEGEIQVRTQWTD